MIKKTTVMDILNNHGGLLERAEEIANALRLASHSEYGDEWVEKEKKFASQLLDEKYKFKDLLAKMKSMADRNVSQLEAVKMLFDLMDSGSTHRQKQLFCEKSKAVIDIQISEVKSHKDLLRFDETFPF